VGNNLNLEGLNDVLIHEVKSSFEVLLNIGEEVTVINDDKDIEPLLAELADAGVNLFDGYSQFQNIFRLGNQYVFQIKKQKLFRTTKGAIIVTNESEFFSLYYKKLMGSYGIISIEPGEAEAGFLVKLLNHVFSSDDVYIHGHEQFNSKYRIRAKDKELAHYVLSDALIDKIAGYDEINMSITNDRLIISCPGIGRTSTNTLITIAKELTR
jgi:hypothetical protein